MGQVSQPSNLLDQIRDLRREIGEIRKAIGLTSATIQSGGLTLLQDAFLRMVDDNDDEIVYLGPDENGRQIIRIRREGGHDVLYTYTAIGGRQFWALTDNTGRIIVSDDAESGVGLARPWLPVPMTALFVPTGAEGTPYPYRYLPASNISTETPLWEGRVSFSHPWLEIAGLWGSAIGTTSATYRIRIDGDQIGAWSTSGTGLRNSIEGPFNVARFIEQDWRQVTVTCAASGTGSVACHVFGLYLRQS